MDPANTTNLNQAIATFAGAIERAAQRSIYQRQRDWHAGLQKRSRPPPWRPRL